MDGQRFDELTRLLAAGVPRRKVLGLIGGGVAAVATRIMPSRAQGTCLNGGDACTETPDNCCPGFMCDVNGTGVCIVDAACADLGESCGIVPTGAPIVSCCGDLICVDGTCAEPVCADIGETCGIAPIGGETIECCGGLECVDNVCMVPGPVCAGEGEACSNIDGANVGCCKDLVCSDDGFCVAPEPTCAIEGESCSNLAGVAPACCDDLICTDEGICAVPGPTCQPEGETCEADTECCEGICCAGACRAIECCIDDPNPNARCGDGQTCQEGICAGVTTGCQADGDCAEGTCCCDDGSCKASCCPAEEEPVTDLPNTGAGLDNGRLSGWLGAAAAGAAAAYLGGKKLQPKPEPIKPTE